ncbi:hypothetical protein Q664_44075 [Archangium violaceum Cb vi76]|uniref:Uncharacterized protein n=1 Tax=Archangium violaceum Cb vi76 TaxID=1406225 RepID=A0A084SHP6_9BACT|nr:hypothetical protein Q664_44075 [Archangium violaceum Cb vi76]
MYSAGSPALSAPRTSASMNRWLMGPSVDARRGDVTNAVACNSCPSTRTRTSRSTLMLVTAPSLCWMIGQSFPPISNSLPYTLLPGASVSPATLPPHHLEGKSYTRSTSSASASLPSGSSKNS